MTIKIHYKAIDSLTMQLYPNKQNYDHFIKGFLNEHFPDKSKRDKDIKFMNRYYFAEFSYGRKGGYPITLKCKGEFIIQLTTRCPKALAPIEIKIIQPNVWNDPVNKMKKFITEMELYVGEVTAKVKLIDVSVNYSGWLINHEVVSNVITSTSKICPYIDRDVVNSLYIGTAKYETPMIKTYNRSLNLRINKRTPDPIEYFSSLPSFNQDFWNFEVTFHTGVFKSRGIKPDLDSVIEAIPSLWNYAMTDFAKVVIPGTDEVCEEWKILTEAVANTNVKKLLRVHSRKKDSSPSYRRKQIKDAIDSYWKLDKKMKVEDILEEIKAMYRP